MEAETTIPGRGSPESAAWFRGKLEELGIGQSAFARLLIRLGDDRKLETILRGLQRMGSGEARVSGEMRAMLNHLVASKAAREKRIARLEAQLSALRSRRGGFSNGGVNVAVEVMAEVERQLAEERDLPLTVLSGAFADAG